MKDRVQQLSTHLLSSTFVGSKLDNKKAAHLKNLGKVKQYAVDDLYRDQLSIQHDMNLNYNNGEMVEIQKLNNNSTRNKCVTALLKSTSFDEDD